MFLFYDNAVISTAASRDISRLCHSGLHHGFAYVNSLQICGEAVYGVVGFGRQLGLSGGGGGVRSFAV